ncbi:MAG: hypothetical protein AAGI89_04335 [Pseudomonadota bacterium]
MALAATLFVALAISPGNEAVAQTFFDGMASGDVEQIKLADAVTFSGPLLNEPLSGKPAVSSFLDGVAAQLSITVEQTYLSETGTCSEVTARSASGIQTEEAICLDIQDGEVTSIRLYFDPRPFLED